MSKYIIDNIEISSDSDRENSDEENSIKKDLIVSEPLCNEKYLKAKIKSCNGKINTNFHNNKIPKEGSPFICLLVILIDSAFKMGKNYYPQVFLEECKYVVKEKKYV